MDNITWHDMVQAYDDLIQTINKKIREQPDNMFWQKELKDALAGRIEAEKMLDVEIIERIANIFERIVPGKGQK